MRAEYITREALEQAMGVLTPANELVVRTMLETGCRVSDVLGMRTAELGERMTVVERKTKKKRRVRVPKWLLEKLREQAGEIWVFEGAHDPQKHRTRQAVWRDVKRAAKAYRIADNVGTHTARKIYAVELMRRYGDVAKVQRDLKHAHAWVTIMYACADTLCTKGTRPKRKRPTRRAKKA